MMFAAQITDLERPLVVVVMGLDVPIAAANLAPAILAHPGVSQRHASPLHAPLVRRLLAIPETLESGILGRTRRALAKAVIRLSATKQARFQNVIYLFSDGV